MTTKGCSRKSTTLGTSLRALAVSSYSVDLPPFPVTPDHGRGGIGAVHHTSLRAVWLMMTLPCTAPVRQGLPNHPRGPQTSPKSGSPLHGATTTQREIVAVLFPHPIRDLSQASRQRHTGDHLPLTLLQRAKPRAQRARPAGCLGRGQHERPAEEPIALLDDVTAPDPLSAVPNARDQSHGAGVKANALMTSPSFRVGPRRHRSNACNCDRSAGLDSPTITGGKGE